MGCEGDPFSFTLEHLTVLPVIRILLLLCNTWRRLDEYKVGVGVDNETKSMIRSLLSHEQTRLFYWSRDEDNDKGNTEHV